MGLEELRHAVEAAEAKAPSPTAKAPAAPAKGGRGMGGDILHGLGLATGLASPENRLEELESIAASALPIGAAGKLAKGAVAGAQRLPGLVRALAPAGASVGTASALEGGKAALQGRPVGEAAGRGALGALAGEIGGGIVGSGLARVARGATAAKEAAGRFTDAIEAVWDRLAALPKTPLRSSATKWIEAPSVSGAAKMSWDEAMKTIPTLKEPFRAVAIDEVARSIAGHDRTAARLFKGAWAQTAKEPSMMSRGARLLESASPALQAVVDSAGAEAAQSPYALPIAGGVASEVGSLPGMLRRIPGVSHILPGGGH